ncbi:MAG TPA: T9SS type A sorting domain-containing protein, partial [Rhodothermales bacterium]|nr:T9SS type A sorting domain-containing protein [Rhodothermales bacterium]
ATGATVDMRSTTAYTFTLVADAAPLEPGTLPSLAPRPAAARFAVAFGAVTGTEGPAAGVPAALALEVRPNPVRGRAAVRFGLPAAGTVRASVYDALGREVAVLLTGDRPAGWHEAALDASALAPGVYVVRLEAGGDARTQRLTVAR